MSLISDDDSLPPAPSESSDDGPIALVVASSDDEAAEADDGLGNPNDGFGEVEDDMTDDEHFGPPPSEHELESDEELPEDLSGDAWDNDAHAWFTPSFLLLFCGNSGSSLIIFKNREVEL